MQIFGNSFRINDIGINAHKAILCIQEEEYKHGCLEIAEAFTGRYTFGFLGTAPWIGRVLHTKQQDKMEAVQQDITELFLKQCDACVVLYYVNIEQASNREYIRSIMERLPEAVHVFGTFSSVDVPLQGIENIEYRDMQKSSFEDVIAVCEDSVSKTKSNRIYPEREPVEWGIFSFAEEKHDQKVLLVGDSISRAYAPLVRGLLPDWDVDTLNTSEGTDCQTIYDELEIALRYREYDVVHLNNGIHLHGISDEQYRENLEKIVLFIQEVSPNSSIILATTTTVSKKKEVQEIFQSDSFQLGDRDPNMEPSKRLYTEYDVDASNRYIGLNSIMKEVAHKYALAIDDLFEVSYTGNYAKCDEVHFTSEGYDALAKAVASSVEREI